MSKMPAFDGRRDRAETTMSSSGSGVDASAVVAYCRGGFVLLNVTLTTSASLSAGALLFNIPGGYRPPPGIPVVFGDLVNTTTGTAVRVHVYPDGTATAENAVGSGVLLRGQIVVPL